MAYTTVCRVEDLPHGTRQRFDVHGAGIVVAYIYHAYYAFVDRCPHQGLPMSNCFFTAGDVVCAWHGACFNLGTGRERAQSDNDGPLQMYEVRIDGDEVQVGPALPLAE